MLVNRAYYREHKKYDNMVLYLPELECSAGFHATPQELLPPSSAEPPRRPAAASPPACPTGTAPGPSAGCALPLQEGGWRQMSRQSNWMNYHRACIDNRTKWFIIV